jgi:hypothetical protein
MSYMAGLRIQILIIDILFFLYNFLKIMKESECIDLESFINILMNREKVMLLKNSIKKAN